MNFSGKTTLLRCVLGRLQPQSGVIRVFGQEPGSEYSPVPGPGVGYMPQELALFPDFTIKETLRYFGQLYRMSAKDIKARTKFLITLLHLPEKNRLVSQLSGELMSNTKVLLHSNSNCFTRSQAVNSVVCLLLRHSCTILLC